MAVAALQVVHSQPLTASGGKELKYAGSQLVPDALSMLVVDVLVSIQSNSSVCNNADLGVSSSQMKFHAVRPNISQMRERERGEEDLARCKILLQNSEEACAKQCDAR